MVCEHDACPLLREEIDENVHVNLQSKYLLCVITKDYQQLGYIAIIMVLYCKARDGVI